MRLSAVAFAVLATALSAASGADVVTDIRGLKNATETTSEAGDEKKSSLGGLGSFMDGLGGLSEEQSESETLLPNAKQTESPVEDTEDVATNVPLPKGSEDNASGSETKKGVGTKEEEEVTQAPNSNAAPVGGSSPVASPISSPVVSPIASPASAPVEAPTIRESENPDASGTPVAAPVTSPIGAPFESPTSNKGSAPVESPTSNKGSAPVESPTSNKGSAPVESPTSNKGFAPVTSPTANEDFAPVASPTATEVLAPIQSPTDSFPRFTPYPTVYKRPTLRPAKEYVPSTDDPIKEEDEYEYDESTGEWFDKESSIEEMEHDRNVVIALSVVFGVMFFFSIFVAYQMLENPDGCCASICRIMLTCVRCICYPCRAMCGCTGQKNPTYAIPDDGHFVNDLELT